MDKAIAAAWDTVKAPLKESLKPEERMEVTTQLSELTTRVATYVICHTLVDYMGLLKDERISIAHAFLQRVTSTHMCNHKLTAEGLVFRYQGEEIPLQEAYKTMTLTRTVYEHLVVFFFLFKYPLTGEESEMIWKHWKRTGQIGLKTKGESTGQLLQSESNLDDTGKIETASRSAFHQLAGNLQDLAPVVLDVTQGTQQQEQTRQGVHTDQIDHLLAAFRNAHRSEKLLHLLGLAKFRQDEQRHLLPLHLVEPCCQTTERRIGKPCRTVLQPDEKSLHQGDEIGLALIMHQRLRHLPIEVSRAVKQQALSKHIACSPLLTSGE